MKKTEIKELENEIVNDEIFLKIEESEDVAGMENCGTSGLDRRYNLWVITLEDGMEIEILS